MQKLLFILLLCPLISLAQNPLPRFENDTLYTTSGYNIFKGLILHLANGTANDGYFRFIKFHISGSRSNTSALQNSYILVKKIKDYKISGLGNHYIRILGTVTYKDESKEAVDITMNFDRAIENFPGLPSELTVPDEFKNKKNGNVADEINKLFKLYKEGALTKEEFEAQKKKLLDQ